MFVNIYQKEIGHYKLSLFKDGRAQYVVLDDFIPCEPYGGPIYSKCQGNELWVVLIEKAFAKMVIFNLPSCHFYNQQQFKLFIHLSSMDHTHRLETAGLMRH